MRTDQGSPKNEHENRFVQSNEALAKGSASRFDWQQLNRISTDDTIGFAVPDRDHGGQVFVEEKGA